MMIPYKVLIRNIKNIIKPPKTEEINQTAASLPQECVTHLPVRIPRAQHILSRQLISKSALKVLYDLHRAGFQALLVGGGVRDVLLGQKPKDFDVVTNARPEQIKALFHNCRLIGRRFSLAHVYVGKEIVEVATFRALHDTEGDRLVENGRILRDNVYGNTVDEDAWRRDFTINALYYDIKDYSILSFAEGIDDLRAGVIRLIGDPLLRYQEDPVRMLRATRFAAKLGFHIAPDTARPIQELGNLIDHVNKSRLYEEVLKLFLTGHAVNSLEQLQHYDLFRRLFPYTHTCFNTPQAFKLVEQTLKNTDERLAIGKPVTAAFLFAALLWPPLMNLLEDWRKRQPALTEQEIFLAASNQLFDQQSEYVAIPRRITTIIQEVWLFQPRLTKRRIKSKRNTLILGHSRFRMSYDFLSLRANSGEPVQEWVDWWTHLQNGTVPANSPTTTSQKSTHSPKKKRRKRSESPHSKEIPES